MISRACDSHMQRVEEYACTTMSVCRSTSAVESSRTAFDSKALLHGTQHARHSWRTSRQQFLCGGSSTRITIAPLTCTRCIIPSRSTCHQPVVTKLVRTGGHVETITEGNDTKLMVCCLPYSNWVCCCRQGLDCARTVGAARIQLPPHEQVRVQLLVQLQERMRVPHSCVGPAELHQPLMMCDARTVAPATLAPFMC
jgi:hypothetical protein